MNNHTSNHMSIYAQRRLTLLESMPTASVALVSGGTQQIRNRDVEFPFRVDSDFWYLTGFIEPDSVLVLIRSEVFERQALDEENKAGESNIHSLGHQAWLFVRPKDPEKEIWQGRRLGVDEAPGQLGIDQAWSIDELDEQAPAFLVEAENLMISFGQLDEWSLRLADWLSGLKAQARKGVELPGRISDLDSLLHEQRLIKSSDEIEWMRKAAQVSVQGHLAAMRVARAGGYEYQLQAELEHCFKRLGSERVAFNTIVATGENACILHYTENNAVLRSGDLVLIDAGAEWQGYAGDISHTFPVNGRFSLEQSQLYTCVLNAQRAAIEQVKPGIAYNQMHQVVLQMLTKGLLDLGLLAGEVDQLIKDQAVKRFFMHGTGHWLGMDVHDVGRYKINGDWRRFQPGMVVTVEPGLYVAPGSKDVDQKWWGIGIRIEDDVLVTETGSEVLTQGLPRSVEEIELWMQNNQ
ncbi:aminopeptidase P N-terminal domain-containing protein [Thiomicrospira sp. R3]|uniref:aminopeptidase P N-terminal domain-containing protein n=1 Tax=Thiomicrospira sp. R3 TaxID=3035472 RepID=UPI00259BC7A0|nr:aminopeptidase P N-terminal domain-containing protein [Thiomicrospira sp. R3]WFE68761.1 aminopeptidase P N-terminal domain-containing protein [Thiomicrospira sp. R3]